ncbi:MAG: hypothetical protein ABWK53_08725 [Anaerolineales bacterium]
MYLPDEIPNAKVLLTVKTYPLPTADHGEVVCTAGLLSGEKWVRLYPIPASLYNDRRYPKYSWVELNLVKHPNDTRPESYMPRLGMDEPMRRTGEIGTTDYWAARRSLVEREVFDSMDELLSLRWAEDRSLGTLKPLEIVDFVWEETEREWKPEWANQLRQLRMFDPYGSGNLEHRPLIKKLPYTFKYRFLSRGDVKPRELSIHDWELGMLYWKCLRQTAGDEEQAIQLVRKKYFDEFVSQKDIFLFLGTTYQYHRRKAPNPFIIIGVFYPPKTPQLLLPL